MRVNRTKRFERGLSSLRSDSSSLESAICSAQPDAVRTPNRASEALEKSFEHVPALQKLLLAQQLGYESFSSMLAASTLLRLSDGSTWWLTADRNGVWMVWNHCSIEVPQNA
jgi:hypothetical protein